MSLFVDAVNQNLLTLAPDTKWLSKNIHYEVIMGSQAYGVSQDSSDIDVYGWCIPPKHMVFPHTAGYIQGFGPEPTSFQQFQKHGVADAQKSREYDFTLYSVVKYLDLVAANNPNMIDSLFVPDNCVLHITAAGHMIRDRRKMMLHKKSYQKFKNYAQSQIHKIRTRESNDDMKTVRKQSIDKFGFDVKYAYHCIRLLDECEQILMYQDIDLQRNREELKAIRRGDWTLEYLIEAVATRSGQLEKLFHESKLPEGPDWDAMRQLLLDVLEHHYGSLSDAIVYDKSTLLLQDLQTLIGKYQ